MWVCVCLRACVCVCYYTPCYSDRYEQELRVTPKTSNNKVSFVVSFRELRYLPILRARTKSFFLHADTSSESGDAPTCTSFFQLKIQQQQQHFERRQQHHKQTASRNFGKPYLIRHKTLSYNPSLEISVFSSPVSSTQETPRYFQDESTLAIEISHKADTL